jgi:hypothetical protein
MSDATTRFRRLSSVWYGARAHSGLAKDRRLSSTLVNFR